jgi:hypothetical protein
MGSVIWTLVVAVSLAAPQASTGEQTPADHLAEATRLLGAVSATDSRPKDLTKRLDTLRTHLGELVTAFQANGDPFAPSASAPKPDEGSAARKDPPNWKASFTQVEKDVAAILGGVPIEPPPELRKQLEAFRLEIELFYASALRLGATAKAT